MNRQVKSYEFAKVLQQALNKGQNEHQITVQELLKELIHQLEPIIKK